MSESLKQKIQEKIKIAMENWDTCKKAGDNEGMAHYTGRMRALKDVVAVLEEAQRQTKERLDSFKGLRWGMRFYQCLGYRITDDEETEKGLTKAMDEIIEQLKKAVLEGESK